MTKRLTPSGITSEPAIPDAHAARRRWMAVLSRAPAAAIEAGLTRHAPLPAWTRVRGPETGLVMVRGRVGGSGAPFNLGEMTVTRCTIRLESGKTAVLAGHGDDEHAPDGQRPVGHGHAGHGHAGHGHVLGRDERRAELAAVADALLQNPVLTGALEETLIRPLAEAQSAAAQERAEKAAATRVEFFAMRTMRS